MILLLLYKHTVSLSLFYRRCLRKFPPHLQMDEVAVFLTNWIKYPFFHFSSSSSSSSYSKKHKFCVRTYSTICLFFRSMLQDYLSVTWIVFWISMFLLCHHPPSKIGLRLRLLQFAIHSQIICSLCYSLSFFLLGNK